VGHALPVAPCAHLGQADGAWTGPCRVLARQFLDQQALCWGADR
jgi:hypothetical protein